MFSRVSANEQLERITQWNMMMSTKTGRRFVVYHFPLTNLCKEEIGNIYGTFKSFVRLEMSS